MAGIDPEALTKVERYRLGIAAIVPRPIAWITTRGVDGLVNVAPFSFFNGVSTSPLIVSLSIAHRDPPKDTLRNLRTNGEAVVHLVPPAQLGAMHQSGGEYGPEVSEAAVLGLALVSSEVVAVPRLSCAEIAFEVRLERIIDVGDGPVSLCLLRAVRVHVASTIADAQGFPDPQRLRTVARLGGSSYLDGDGWTLRDLPRVKV